eukprot:31388-Pelagococcus_subviridis.AAC.18
MRHDERRRVRPPPRRTLRRAIRRRTVRAVLRERVPERARDALRDALLRVVHGESYVDARGLVHDDERVPRRDDRASPVRGARGGEALRVDVHAEIPARVHDAVRGLDALRRRARVAFVVRRRRRSASARGARTRRRDVGVVHRAELDELPRVSRVHVRETERGRDDRRRGAERVRAEDDVLHPRRERRRRRGVGQSQRARRPRVRARARARGRGRAAAAAGGRGHDAAQHRRHPARVRRAHPRRHASPTPRSSL